MFGQKIYCIDDCGLPIDCTPPEVLGAEDRQRDRFYQKIKKRHSPQRLVAQFA